MSKLVQKNTFSQILFVVWVLCLIAGCSEANRNSVDETTSDTVADRFWLLSDIINSEGTGVFQLAPEDFFRYTVRFRSDTAYILQTFCNERGGFYSFEDNNLMVTPPMLTGQVFDCPPPPESLTSFNDTSSINVFSMMIDSFNMGAFSAQVNGDVLQLSSPDGMMLVFRECITDCFIAV